MAKIAVLIGHGFEDSEYAKPAKAFKDAGHELTHIGVKRERVKGEHGQAAAQIDLTAKEADVDDYDALFIPGGHSPDNIRKDQDMVRFAREFAATGMPMLVICHGPQLLITAGVVEGRTMTSWPTVQVDLSNAGAAVRDEPVVVDANLITSRSPDDIPQFIDASLEMLSQSGGESAAGRMAET